MAWRRRRSDDCKSDRHWTCAEKFFHGVQAPDCYCECHVIPGRRVEQGSTDQMAHKLLRAFSVPHRFPDGTMRREQISLSMDDHGLVIAAKADHGDDLMVPFEDLMTLSWEYLESILATYRPRPRVD